MRRARVAVQGLGIASAILVLLLGPVAVRAAGPVPPRGRITGAQPLSQVEQIDLPAVDNQALVAEEMRRAEPGGVPRFALPRELAVSPLTEGTWETLPDGTLLWRVRLRSRGALSLNLGFERFRMPEGGRLAIYTPDYGTMAGPFTAADNEVHGQLWTPMIPGDEVVVEVNLPAEAVSGLELVLGSVNHGYLDPAKAPLSGACNVDVTCSADDGLPQVDPWRSAMRSVARLTIGGIYYCTGFLVNNTALDRRPLLMTAYHCNLDAGNAASLVAYWGYENSTCRPPGSAASGEPGDGMLDRYNTGSLWRSAYAPSDFTLVELDDPVDSLEDVFWAGWDATPVNASSAVTIHHPEGEEKRISFEDQPVTTTSYLGDFVPGDGTHIRVADWDLGTTEPGSSGAPLFNQAQRIIGQLHGGYAACGNDQPDWYGWLAASWTGGGTRETRLRDWLDPAGTGAVVLDGLEDTPGFRLSANPFGRAICAPEAAQYTIDVEPEPGFSDQVALAVQDLPQGATASFSMSPVVPPASSLLTIGNTASILPGGYILRVTGQSGSLQRVAEVRLDVFAGLPGVPWPVAPADGQTEVALRPTLAWLAAPAAGTYTVEVATDPGFANVLRRATGVTGTSYMLEADLAGGVTYYWRVWADNACGAGGVSETRRFTTSVAPGQCGQGFVPDVILWEDFESGASGWEHGGDGDSWTIVDYAEPRGGAYHAEAPGFVTDQWLASPGFGLPEDRADLTLAFWNIQSMEARQDGCFDGGVLELSSDDGQSWQEVDSGLLTDPYDGPISASYGNPLGGRNAWCGDPQDWLRSVVDLDRYAGQAVRVRFRLGTDSSVGRAGWSVDDVVVQGCRPFDPDGDLPYRRIFPLAYRK
jgi:hypothetical protein